MHLTIAHCVFEIETPIETWNKNNEMAWITSPVLFIPDIRDLFQLSESSNFEVESSLHYPACCSLQIHLSLSPPVVPAPLARAGSSKPTIHIAISRGISMATTCLLLPSHKAMGLAAH